MFIAFSLDSPSRRSFSWHQSKPDVFCGLLRVFESYTRYVAMAIRLESRRSGIDTQLVTKIYQSICVLRTPHQFHRAAPTRNHDYREQWQASRRRGISAASQRPVIPPGYSDRSPEPRPPRSVEGPSHLEASRSIPLRPVVPGRKCCAEAGTKAYPREQ